MKEPYLIQRCRIKAPWTYKHKFKPKGVKNFTLKVSELLEFEYMGAAEFEYGAIPAAIRAMHAEIDNFQYEHIVVHGGVTDGIVPTLVRPEQLDFVRSYLKRLGSDGYQKLHESTNFEQWFNSDVKPLTNFWICIDKGQEFVFAQTGDARGFDAVGCFKECLKNSVNFMNGVKAIQGFL